MGAGRVEAKAHAGKCSEQYAGFVRVAADRVSGGFLGTSATGSVSKDGHLRLAIDVGVKPGVLAGARGLGGLEIADLQRLLDRAPRLTGRPAPRALRPP